jgi:hypothetical protein
MAVLFLYRRITKTKYSAELEVLKSKISVTNFQFSDFKGIGSARSAVTNYQLVASPVENPCPRPRSVIICFWMAVLMASRTVFSEQLKCLAARA